MNNTKTDDESIQLIKAQIQTENDEIANYNQQIASYKTKIEAKHELADEEKRDLDKWEKGTITRFNNNITIQEPSLGGLV